MTVCRAHDVRYPLNWNYKGMGFAGCCPKCDPEWKTKCMSMRDTMLADAAKASPTGTES